LVVFENSKFTPKQNFSGKIISLLLQAFSHPKNPSSFGFDPNISKMYIKTENICLFFKMLARHKLFKILSRAVLAVPAARNLKCAVPCLCRKKFLKIFHPCP
jgi:hypothetical protein